MYSKEDKGVVFYETVITLKWQKHSVIECVPVPWEQFDVLPGYFMANVNSPSFLTVIHVGVYFDERGGMVATQKTD